MRFILSSILAITVASVLSPNARADDLVLEFTTKAGVEKIVTVDKVKTVAHMPHVAFHLPNRAWSQNYLALTPSSWKTWPSPGLFIAVPWAAIKEVAFDKAIATVTCVDGASFKGLVLTEVTTTDKLKYHLAQCTKLAVKSAPKAEKPSSDHRAKCTLRFNNLDQTFEAQRLRYIRYRGVGFNPADVQKFQMKVDGEVLDGNFPDFSKVVVNGSESGPIPITVLPPKGKERNGELLVRWADRQGLEKIGTALFVFEAANGSAIVLDLRYEFATPTAATFSLTVEATKKGESLPPELFKGIVGKK